MCGLASGPAAGRCPVSVEAISWALNLAPGPADSGGQNRADRRLGARSVRSRSGSEGAQNSQLGAQVKYG
jgi:hypothetical protein